MLIQIKKYTTVQIQIKTQYIVQRHKASIFVYINSFIIILFTWNCWIYLEHNYCIEAHFQNSLIFTLLPVKRFYFCAFGSFLHNSESKTLQKYFLPRGSTVIWNCESYTSRNCSEWPNRGKLNTVKICHYTVWSTIIITHNIVIHYITHTGRAL